MHTIVVKSLRYTAIDKELFQNIDFILNGNDRIALIGENGVGKTTLMKILAGQLEFDSGNLVKEDWINCELISQDFSGDLDKTVIDYLDKIDAFDKAIHLMQKMGFDLGKNQTKLNLKLRDLSGGERRIVELSIAINSNSYFLFIDEPENHLSIRARFVLCETLKSYWGGVVIVSHDRFIINSFSNKIIEIEDKKTRSFKGSFEDYQEYRAKLKFGEIRDWEEKKKLIARMKEILPMLRRKAEVNSAAAGTYQQKKRRYEELCESIGERPESDRSSMKIQISEVEKKNGKIIAKLEDFTFGYPNQPILFKDCETIILFGEKVALVGNNGVGKTTLIKLLTGELEPTKGVAKLGVNIKIGNFEQHNNFGDFEDKNAIYYLQYILNLDEPKACSVLAKILFNRTEMLKPISMLSGGQRTRLRMSVLFGQNPELIILDEPTNNLDITSWDFLVESLNEFTGSMILISHDKDFVEAVSDRIFYLHDKMIQEWFGDFDDLIQNMLIN